MYIVFDQTHCIERVKADMTWDGTVKDLADMQFENLSEIIELATGRDVTDRMVRAAMQLRDDRGADYSHAFFELVELTLGTRVAHSMSRRAA